MKDLELIISEVKKFDLADEKRQLDANLFASKQKLAIIKARCYLFYPMLLKSKKLLS